MSNVSIYTLIYALVAIISFVVIVFYLNYFKKNLNKDGLGICIAIFIINFGYFLMSFTKNLTFVIYLNRFVYLGNIILLIEMLIIINDFCNGTKNKSYLYVIMTISVIIYLLILTGGTNIKLYYTNVGLRFEDNLTIFVKEYGVLHILYTYYVFLMFILMMIRIVYSIIKKIVRVYINPIVLVFLGFENMFVWFVQRIVNVRLEILSISYIITEILFILLIRNAEEFKKINENANNNGLKSIESIIQNWTIEYALTERESEVLELLINNISRADIAEELFISEHTVKKHTANIYAKMAITSRNELLYRLNEEISKVL